MWHIPCYCRWSPAPITTERAGHSAHGAVSTLAAHIRVKSRYCVPIIGILQPPARSTVRPGKVKSYETPDSDRILVMPGRVKDGSNVSLYKKCLVWLFFSFTLIIENNSMIVLTSFVQYNRTSLPVLFWRVVFRNRTGRRCVTAQLTSYWLLLSSHCLWLDVSFFDLRWS